MGMGDEIMAAGCAEEESRRRKCPVHITGVDGKPRWVDLWENNPHIAKPNVQAFHRVINGPGCRPYIKGDFTLSERQHYTSWRAQDHRGHIFLSDKEKSFGKEVLDRLGPFVVVEPNNKVSGNPNKAWPWWKELIPLLKGHRLVQMGSPNPALQRRIVMGGRKPLKRYKLKMLPGVEYIPTPVFRDACAVLARASALVTTEGGLHHAAAALGVKAVVIFSGSPPVESTGYPEHVNLGGTDTCGRWQPCDHCQKLMRAITPEMVSSSLRKICSPV